MNDNRHPLENFQLPFALFITSILILISDKSETTAAVIVGLVGFILLILSILSYGEAKKEYENRNKIIALSKEFHKALQKVESINTEIKSKSEELNKLKKSASVSEELQALSKRQISAIEELLTTELSLESKKSLRRDVIIAVASAFLGVFIGKLVS